MSGCNTPHQRQEIRDGPIEILSICIGLEYHLGTMIEHFMKHLAGGRRALVKPASFGLVEQHRINVDRREADLYFRQLRKGKGREAPAERWTANVQTPLSGAAGSGR